MSDEVKSITRRIAVGLLAGVIAGVGLLYVVLFASTRAQTSGRADRAAVISTNAAAAVANAKGGEAEAGTALAAWVRSHPQVRAYRLVNVDNRSIEASSFPDDRKEGELPRRMVRSEKPLYDLGQSLQTNVETNRADSKGNRDELSVEASTDNLLLIAAPVEKDGTVVGYVQLLIAPAGQTSSRPPSLLIALGFIIAPLVVFFALGPMIGRSSRMVAVVVAAVLLLATLFAYGSWGLSALVSGARQTEARFGDQVRKEAGLAGAIAPGAEATSAAWDSDLQRHPLQTNVQKTVAAQTKAVLSAGWGIATLSLILLSFFGFGFGARVRAAVVRNRQAYTYVAPAIAGMMLLVFFPFFYGIALSFTSQNIYSVNQPLHEIWIGVQNYAEILGDFRVVKESASGTTINFQNFYWTLLFTVLWTICNVTIGVTLGLLLALSLNTKGLRFKAGYRVLLILPWALPNYITALIWKGMFHQQFGVINQVIQLFGGSPVSWFEHPTTSFVAVVTTNGWLSFPFMMVVALGALQSIPADLYEAARVDGASRWQQFTSITLPSLKPALVPAIILSVVWTFNMFNIIYLVSAGEPAGSTEILITQAYKIAFEQYRYGYAAAYSTVIFAILLIYGVFQNRMSRATEAIA